MALLEDVFTAYYDARRNKRNTYNQLHFEFNLEENLISLYRELEERRYAVGRSICFMILNPVKREVFAANFRDRVVHHVLYNYINPVFDKMFIVDCYSCREGKGTLFGINRLAGHIRSCSDNYRKPCYILKLDLRGYFMNINRQILFDYIQSVMLKKGNKKNAGGVCWRETPEYEMAMYLLPLIIFNDPVKNCIRKGDLAEWEGLPPSKSLFFSPPGCGLPIGNLTSQLFSNIYLNEFDNYVKRSLGIKHYGRYVDDFYLVHTDRKHLLSLIPVLKNYLWTTRGATIHPNKIMLLDCWQGVPFLGSVVKPYRIYLGNRTFKQFGHCLEGWMRELGGEGEVPEERVKDFRSSINSYLGMTQHFNSLNRKKELIERYPFVFRLGYFNGEMNKFIIKKREKERSMSGVPEATVSGSETCKFKTTY